MAGRFLVRPSWRKPFLCALRIPDHRAAAGLAAPSRLLPAFLHATRAAHPPSLLRNAAGFDAPALPAGLSWPQCRLSVEPDAPVWRRDRLPGPMVSSRRGALLL